MKNETLLTCRGRSVRKRHSLSKLGTWRSRACLSTFMALALLTAGCYSHRQYIRSTTTRSYTGLRDATETQEFTLECGEGVEEFLVEYEVWVESGRISVECADPAGNKVITEEHTEDSGERSALLTPISGTWRIRVSYENLDGGFRFAAVRSSGGFGESEERHP